MRYAVMALVALTLLVPATVAAPSASACVLWYPFSELCGDKVGAARKVVESPECNWLVCLDP